MRYAALLLSLTFSSCASVEVQSWDADKQEITACGNEYADINDLRKAVAPSCKADLIPVRFSQRKTGTSGTISDGAVLIQDTRDGCVTFRCVKPKK